MTALDITRWRSRWHAALNTPRLRTAGYASAYLGALLTVFFVPALAASAHFTAQRLLVAAMIALLPPAESLRLGLGAAAGVEG